MTKTLEVTTAGAPVADGAAFVRKTFTQAEKDKAVNLVLKDGYTIQKAADAVGCSVPSLINWKKEALGAAAGKSASSNAAAGDAAAPAKRVKKIVKKVKRPGNPQAKPVGSFDEFAEKFWAKYPKDTVGSQSVHETYRVLQFVYDEFFN